MGLRYRKSIKLGKGIRLNINKNSIGLSAGVKGARVSVNSKGRKTTTLSIPGTGISYSKTSSIKSGKQKSTAQHHAYTISDVSEANHPSASTGEVTPSENYNSKQKKHPGAGWVLRILGVITILLSLIVMIVSPFAVLGVLIGLAEIIYSGKQIGDDTLPLPMDNDLLEEGIANE